MSYLTLVISVVCISVSALSLSKRGQVIKVTYLIYRLGIPTGKVVQFELPFTSPKFKGETMTLTSDTAKVRVLRPYLVYVLLFVGAGMVSGGVVHYPLNKSFYGILTVVGGIVFVIGSLTDELLSGKGLPKPAALFSLIVTSLLLSFGIGMLSGGIQHFTDFPPRAAVLVPLGITLSFIAFCFKSNLFRRDSIKKVSIAGFLILGIAVSSLAVLTNIADGMNKPAHTHEVTTSVGTTPAEDHSKHPHNE